MMRERPSKDEQLLTKTFLKQTKNMNMEDGFKSIFMFCFTEKTHKPLYLDT
jgi:hypothetical protein